jgi:hypothetical protein
MSFAQPDGGIFVKAPDFGVILLSPENVSQREIADGWLSLVEQPIYYCLSSRCASRHAQVV